MAVGGTGPQEIAVDRNCAARYLSGNGEEEALLRKGG